MEEGEEDEEEEASKRLVGCSSSFWDLDQAFSSCSTPALSHFGA